MKKAVLQFFIFVSAMAILFACEPGGGYNKFKSVSPDGWNKDSLLIFDIPVTDTIQNQNIFINVRNDVNYKYSNLWLFIKIAQPGGTEVTDTFEITLADPAGKWLGKGFGGVKTLETMYKRNVYFPVSGDYKIEIQQGMREDVLKGITDIGIRLEKQD